MKILSFSILLFTVLSLASCKKSGTSSTKSDTTKPSIVLNGSDNMEIPFGLDTPDPGATATDDIDGDLTSAIVSDWTSKVQKNTLGDYTVTYMVSDKSGNQSSITRKVSVKLNATSYFGNYNTTYAVVGGGASNCVSTIVAGDNASQFTVNYYLGPGGFPFKVNMSGPFGTQLSVNTTSNGVTLTGTGTSENGGQKIILNLTQIYGAFTTNLVATFTRQ